MLLCLNNNHAKNSTDYEPHHLYVYNVHMYYLSLLLLGFNTNLLVQYIKLYSIMLYKANNKGADQTGGDLQV